jgi:hypothetical protein
MYGSGGGFSTNYPLMANSLREISTNVGGFCILWGGEAANRHSFCGYSPALDIRSFAEITYAQFSRLWAFCGGKVRKDDKFKPVFSAKPTPEVGIWRTWLSTGYPHQPAFWFR